MLIGIYLMPGPIYEFRGLYFDQSIKFYVFRLVFLLMFVSPLALIYFPKINIEHVILIKAALLPLVVGYMLSHPYIILMKKLTDEFNQPEVEASGISSDNSENQHQEAQLEDEEIKDFKHNF